MRICFHLRVKPNRIEEYKRIHQAVWPEMLSELRRAGIRSYSIFMWRDGHEFGFLECEDWSAVQAHLAASPIARKWETFMSDYLETPVGPDGPSLLEEVFRLDGD